MPAGSVFVLLPLLGVVAVVLVALAVRETIAVVVVINISPALLYCVCVCVCVCLRLSHALVVAQRSYEEKIKQRRHTPSPQNPLFLIFFFENSPKKNESSFHLSVCDFTQI
jgi:hypothetical protein